MKAQTAKQQVPEVKPMPTVEDVVAGFYGELDSALGEAYLYAERLTFIADATDRLRFDRDSVLNDHEIMDLRDELDAVLCRFHGAVERWKAKHGLPHNEALV